MSGSGPTLQPQGWLVFRGNHDADYTVLRAQRMNHNVLNNVPYDMNWGRSMLTPFDTAFYPHDRIESIFEQVPSNPYAIPRATDWRQLPFDPLPTPSHVRAYDTSASTQQLPSLLRARSE